MSRLVSDQQAFFNSNDMFRRLSHESEVRYIGCKDLTLEERQHRFYANCRSGRAEIAFVNTGTNFVLQFFPWDINSVQGMSPPKEYVNFDLELGKVHLKAPFILNGVCVCWKGWIHLSQLDGMAFIEFDEERAALEASRQQLQPSTSQLHLDKVSAIKLQSRKHGAIEDGPNHLDKRARLR